MRMSSFYKMDLIAGLGHHWESSLLDATMLTLNEERRA
jgi:hypothetical protein